MNWAIGKKKPSMNPPVITSVGAMALGPGSLAQRYMFQTPL